MLKRRRHLRPMAALLALAAAGSGCELKIPGAESSGAGSAEGARVIRAVDGDTLLVNAGGRERYVRLIGIDTPESVRPGLDPECGSIEASASMKALAREGSKVKLTSDPTQERVDRYGRLLRYTEIGGRDVAEVQLRRGHAEPYVYEDNPFERLERYESASRRAQSRGAGVWSSCGGDFHSGS